jgi:hypothetical protein
MRRSRATSRSPPASAEVSTPALAAAPDGRIWVAWVERDGRTTKIVARRSNRTGTAFGAPVTATPPGGISTAAVNLAAQADRTDLIALVQSPGNALSITHTQLWPGLTLVRGGITRRRRNAVVTLRALDAGEPVAGVRVRLGGTSATTAANGTAPDHAHALGTAAPAHRERDTRRLRRRSRQLPLLLSDGVSDLRSGDRAFAARIAARHTLTLIWCLS